MNNETFHSEEFFVERVLNNEGKLELVSQRRPVDFDQFPDAVNLDKYPDNVKSKKVEGCDDEIIGITKDGKPVFRNTDNSDIYKRPENFEIEVEMTSKETFPESKKTKRKSRRKKLTVEQSAPFFD